MNTRSLLIALGALFIAVIAAVVARNLFAGASAPQTVAKPVADTKSKVLVAVKSIPTGKILVPEDLKFASWPVDAIDPTFYKSGVADAAQLAGKVVRQPVLAGQPISSAGIIGPGERGFLAAVLKPGMRAVSVQVNMVTGVGGFIFPGDRVDLILTHEVPNGVGLQLRGAETILSNVRVLAMNQVTNDTEKTPQAPNNVTLELPPKFVELVNVAVRLGGTLSMSLQPLADNSGELADGKAAVVAKPGQLQPASKTDPKAPDTLVAATDPEAPMMPDVKTRSLTLDRDFSKLITMAKIANSGATSGGPIGPTGPVAAPPPPKPDMVISRGEAAEKIFFKQPSQ